MATLHEGRDTCAITGGGLTSGAIGAAERSDSCVVLGTVAFQTTATIAAQEGRDTCAIGTGNNDFITRRTSPGVFRWFDFNSTSQLGLNISGGGSLGNTPTTSFGYSAGGGPNATTPSIDLGRGALHLQALQGSTNDGPGKWQTKFSDDGSRVFRSNCEFYAQFSFEQDGYYSPGALGVGYGPKFAYFGGDNVGSTLEDSILVVPVYYASGLAFIYTYLPVIGTYGLGPFNSGTGGNDIQTSCPYPFSAGTCVGIPINKKVWFQIGVQLGNFVTGNISGTPYDGVEAAVQMWITVDGVTTKFVDWASSQSGQYPFMANHTAGANAFSRIMFDAYQTSKDPTTIHPTYNQFYDELILSTQRIPDPSSVAAADPAWLSTINQHTITNIGDGSTQSSVYAAAGYAVDGWRGDQGTYGYNYTAWAGGVLMPAMGVDGTLVIGANGHELEPASSLSAFDIHTASWSIIGPPQIHRQVPPSLVAPPADAELWWNPTRTGVTDYTSFTYSGLTGRTAVAQRYFDTGVGVATPWADGSYSFKSYPPTYMRYQTNVGSAMRYDNYVCIPQEFGGEAYGTLVVVCPHEAHETAGEREFRNKWTWRFGCSSQAWLPHSTNQFTLAAGVYQWDGSQANTAHSEKYNKIFAACQNSGLLGCYDVATNTHVDVDCHVVWTHFPEESKAIVTHGHAAHLFICGGSSFGTLDPAERMLFVADLDEVMAGTSTSYAITNTGAGHGFPLLTPAIDWFGGDVAGYSLAWFRGRQKLVLFKAPRGISDGATTQITPSQRARLAPIDSGLIHIITIPTNWKVDPWTVETVPITLGTGTTAVHTGSVGKPYGRFCALETLDLALYIGAPDEGLPAQIIDVFGIGN